MIPSTFRRTIICRRSIGTIPLKNHRDVVSRIADRYRLRSFSSSIRESTAADSNGSMTSTESSEVLPFPVAATASPDVNIENQVSLNSKERRVGYLNRILNARVYEAAIETELQHAENLSNVSSISYSWTLVSLVANHQNSLVI